MWREIRVIGAAIALLVGNDVRLLIALGLNGVCRPKICLLKESPWIWTCSAGLAVWLPFLSFSLISLFFVSMWWSERPACSCSDACHAACASTSMPSKFSTNFSICLSFLLFTALVTLWVSHCWGLVVHDAIFVHYVSSQKLEWSMIYHHDQTMPFLFLKGWECGGGYRIGWLMCWLLVDTLYWLMAVATWLL